MPYQQSAIQEITGARTFRIEAWEQWPENFSGDNTEKINFGVFLIPKNNPERRVSLPVPPIRKTNPFPFDRFFVSPDEQTILAARKRYSGANDVFVLNLDGTPLHYRLADRVSLNERIARKYGRPPDPTDPDRAYSDPSVEFINFLAWQPNGRDALLACHYGSRNKGVYYLVTLTPHTGHLSHYHPTTDNQISKIELGAARKKKP